MRPGASRQSVSRRLLNLTVAAATAIGSLLTIAPPAPVRAAPLLGGQLFSTGGLVEIEVLPASAGLTSELYLLEPQEILIATNREVGKLVEIGPFESGVELIFGIRVGGNEFRMGPGDRNPDGIVHATVDFIEQNIANVGFEDLFGGGDRDYDDNRFQFRGGIAAEPPPPDPDPEPEPEPGTPPVAAAGPDQGVPEGSVVQLDGTASSDPGGGGLVPSNSAGNLPGGTSIEAALSELSPPADGEQLLTASAALGEGTAVANTALVYVFDISGSTLSGGGCGGDANGDGRSNNRLDCEVAAARALNQRAVASGTVAEVGLIGFASGGVAADLSPELGVQSMSGPGTDADDSGTPDVEQAMASVFSVGFGGSVGFNLFTRRTTGNTTTNFSAGLTAGCDLMASSAQPNRIVVFLSDGENNAGVHVSNVLPCEPPATFHTFAAGPGVSCASNPSRGGLQTIANLTGGTCTNVTNLANLPDILDDLVGSRLLRIELSIDGGDPVDITASATPTPPVDGPASVQIAHAIPDLGDGLHELCLTVHGLDAGGEGSVTTCTEVGAGGELTYRWELVESEGPPIILSSATSPQPTFLAIDDGTYTFELTVTNGFGLTGTDRVVVTVENVAPSLMIESSEATARGVTLVNASFTDEGWLDHHAALIDWGDGTEPDAVAISAQGTGWGGFFGSHIYDTAGSFTVTATVTDDDGGTSIASTLELTVAEPVAVWANSRSTKKTFEWTGGGGSITGRVHSNNEVKVAGAEPKTIDGPLEYVTTIAVDGPHSVTPVQSTVQPFPITYVLADYAPGGPVSVAVSAAYFDHTVNCVGGMWDVGSAMLPSGVHYAPCAVKLNGSSIGGRFTLAATGAIELSGSRPAFEPYYDGLLLLSGATGKKAINVSASASKFLGVIFAGSGEVSLSGSGGRFFCGIYGDTVTASGSNLTLRGATCGRPDSTVSGPLLVPELGLGLEGDPADVLPGDTIDYQLTLTNDGALLVVPGVLGLENVDTSAATTAAYRYVLEYYSIADGAWVPLGSAAAAADGYTPIEPLPTTGGITLSARPNAGDGVTYASDGDVLLGAGIGPGAFATWGYQALVELTPDQVNLLMDAALVGGLRNQIEFELTPAETQVRRVFRFGNDFIGDVRALSGDITDVEVTSTRPTGDPTFLDSTTTPALATLPPGVVVEIPDSYGVGTLSPRADGESDAAYRARLLAGDGAELFAAAFARAAGGVGLLVAPQVHVGSTQHVPVVDVTKAGPASALAGDTLEYELTLTNRGSTAATDVALADRLDGEPVDVAAVPTTFVAGQIVTREAAYTIPADHAGGSVTNRAEATWTDAAGNAYGPLGSDVETAVLTPPDLAATLADSLAVDADANGVISPGDTVAYEAVVRNDGDSPLSAVVFDLDTDPKSALVPGSVSTTIGAVTAGNTDGDTSVAVDLGTLGGHALASIHFRVTIDDPYEFDETLLSVQGTLESDELDPVLTDDPGLTGPADPTTTRVVIPAPMLHATLTDAVAIDRDANGAPSPDDTLRYTARIENQGSAPATVLSVMLTPDQNSTLVADSVTSSAGVITSGQGSADGFVKVILGELEPLAVWTVTFDVRIADPFPSGVVALGVQGIVNATEFGDPVLTDDPDTAAEADPTVTTLNLAGGPPGSGLPAPTIGEVTPAEGAAITDPTPITATLAPPDGETVAGWTVSYRLEGDGTRTEIASGTGTTVDATLDPTVMPNGAYVIEIEAAASGGGVSIHETSVVVEGNLKLGRFQVTYQDLSVPVGGIPIRVLRTYDSFDKSRGDFGIGWRLDLANFQVATNGPLGQGGWTMFGCGGGLIFVPLCFESDRPHYVTVTWPDGRVEKFDLTPAQGSSFLPGLTQARFTARPGTTSTLSALDNGLYWSGDGNLYGGLFGSGGLYDPTRFRLTDRFDTEYLLDTERGLVSATDRNGNTVTVTSTGITSSLGPSIAFTRDGLGRITTVTGPDGGQLTYAYDGAGDLVVVTDPNARVVSHEYDGNHNLEVTNDPLGRPFQTQRYDDEGRLASVTDAVGNEVTIDVDPDARIETVTDAEGRLTTISELDERGNVVRRRDLYDGKTATSEFAYDAFDNVTARTDPLGHIWSATWDEQDLRTFTDPTGRTTEIRYDPLGLPVRWIQPSGAETVYRYDTAGNLASITDPLGHAETYTYDGAGNRTSRTDREGHTWTYGYAGGRVETVTDPLENTTRYTYDAAGRLETETDPTDRVTRYAYWPDGQLRSVTAPGDVVTSYEYDELGLLERRVDPAGKAWVWNHDPAGRLEVAIDPLGHETTYAYDGNGQLLTTTAADGGVTTNAYDGAGRLASVTDQVGRVTSYAHDLAGRLASTENAAGGVGTYVHDDAGRLLREHDPLGHETVRTYDADGNVETITDPRGHLTRFDHDLAGRRIRTTDALGGVTLIGHDRDGRVVSQTNPEGETTVSEYDPVGRIASAIDPLGHATTYAYDDAGRLTSTTDPLGHAETRTYDAAGRLAAVTTAAGITTTYAYDSRGLVSTITDELGNSTQRGYDDAGRLASERNPRGFTTTFDYDEVGRLAEITDPKLAVIQFGHNLAGEQTTITDPLGETWSTAYDPLGGVATEVDPLGNQTTLTYNEAGQLERKTDARGVIVDYRYDAAGNLEFMGSVSETVEFGYDPLNRRSTMTDGSGVTTWVHDGASRVTSVAAPAGTIGYSYDDAGRRATMTLPSGVVEYGYHDDGRLATVEMPGAGTFGFTYLADDRPDTLTRPNGVTTEYAYDAVGRLDSVAHVRGASSIKSFEYTLDENGNRTSMTSAMGTESYTLDELDQLVQVALPGGAEIEYGYDAAGNRTTETVGGVTTTSVYDDASRLAATGTTAYTYDEEGNLLSADDDAFAWDDLGRLATATVDGTTTTYASNGDGMRVAATTDGTTTPYLWDHDAPLGELVGDGSATFLHANGVLLAEQGATSTRYPLADAIGSIRALTDGAGGVIGTASFDSFGTRTTSGPASIFGFTGEQTDPTGLIYLRARYLDPDSGRFLSVDPLRPGAPGVVGYNPYAYVANNPTTWTDPSGAGLPGMAVQLRTVAVGTGATIGVGIAVRELLRQVALWLLPVGTACALVCDVVLPPIAGNPPRTVDDPPLERDRPRPPRTDVQERIAQELAGARGLTLTVARAIAASCAGIWASAAFLGDIESVCSGRVIPIYVSGGDMMDTSTHDLAAIGGGKPPVLSRGTNPYRAAGGRHGWYDLVMFQPNNCTGRGAQVCDEYPFWSTTQGGPGASLQPVPPAESETQLRAINAFYGACRVRPNTGNASRFLVVPVPVEGVPSIPLCLP